MLLFYVYTNVVLHLFINLMNCRIGTGHMVSIKIPIDLRTRPETLHWVATLWDRGGHA